MTQQNIQHMTVAFIWNEKKINSTKKLILLALSHFGGEALECSTSTNDLADLCGLARATVSRNLGKLAQEGYIKITPQYSKSGQKNNTYRINVEKLFPVSETQSYTSV